jgi:hypothetical protein
MENEQLMQEVARLGKALYDKKSKAKQTQPPQDNTTMGVNKPGEGEIVVVGYATRKATSLTSTRRKSGRSKRKSQQAKYPTPTSKRWIKRSLHHI